jgi:hypothetical protein
LLARGQPVVVDAGAGLGVFSRVTELVFVTRPVITTWSPGFGADGVNESMATSTTGSSADGLATASGPGWAATDAAITRLAPTLAQSLSRRLNTPSP